MGTWTEAHWYPRGINGDMCVRASTVLVVLRKSNNRAGQGRLSGLGISGKRTAATGFFRGNHPATLFLLVTLDPRQEGDITPTGKFLLKGLGHDPGRRRYQEPHRWLSWRDEAAVDLGA